MKTKVILAAIVASIVYMTSCSNKYVCPTYTKANTTNTTVANN